MTKQLIIKKDDTQITLLDKEGVEEMVGGNTNTEPVQIEITYDDESTETLTLLTQSNSESP